MIDKEEDRKYSEASVKRMVVSHTFAVEFCFAVETTFITALLVEYAMESIIDSFIWIIPNILLIILRPYYQSYIERRRQSLHTYVNNSVACFILAGCGNLIVLASTYPQFFIDKRLWWFYHFLRIIMSAIGWTLVDVSLDLVSGNRDKLMEKEGEESENQVLKVEHIAQVLAFLLAFHACSKSPSWINFHLIVDVLYLTSALLCFTTAFITCLQRKAEQTFRAINPASIFSAVLDSIRQVPRGHMTFFPGARRLKAAPWQIKSHLISTFCSGYAVDAIMIYSCMWFVWAVGEHQQELTSSILITGLRFGSLFLALFSFNGFLVKKFCSRLLIAQLKMTLLLTLIANIIATTVAISGMHIVAIGCVVVFGSTLRTLQSMYLQRISCDLTDTFEHYENCSHFVTTMQQLFTLSVMPFFWMIIMKDDDTMKCLHWSLMALVIMLLLHVQRLLKRDQEKAKYD